MGTHLNCTDKSMQFIEYPQHMLYKEVDKKYTGCNLKTTELLDCALIEICAVIRSNTLIFFFFFFFSDKISVTYSYFLM